MPRCVKLYDAIQCRPWSKNPYAWPVYIYIRFNVNDRPREKDGIRVEKNQVLFSELKLSKALYMSKPSLRKAISALCDSGDISVIRRKRGKRGYTILEINPLAVFNCKGELQLDEVKCKGELQLDEVKCKGDLQLDEFKCKRDLQNKSQNTEIQDVTFCKCKGDLQLDEFKCKRDLHTLYTISNIYTTTTNNAHEKIQNLAPPPTTSPRDHLPAMLAVTEENTRWLESLIQIFQSRYRDYEIVEELTVDKLREIMAGEFILNIEATYTDARKTENETRNWFKSYIDMKIRIHGKKKAFAPQIGGNRVDALHFENERNITLNIS